MERREVLMAAAGIAAGMMVPAAPAAAHEAHDSLLTDVAASMQAAIAEYRTLVATASSKPAYPAFKQMEAFTWHRDLRGSTVRATVQVGLLDLRFTVQGPDDMLERLQAGLAQEGQASLRSDGKLTLVVRALASNEPVHRLFVRVVRAA